MSTFATVRTPWPVRMMRVFLMWLVLPAAFVLIGLYLVGPRLGQQRVPPAVDTSSADEPSRSTTTSRPPGATSPTQARVSVREVTDQTDQSNNDSTNYRSQGYRSSDTNSTEPRHTRTRHKRKPRVTTEAPPTETPVVQPPESPDAAPPTTGE